MKYVQRKIENGVVDMTIQLDNREEYYPLGFIQEFNLDPNRESQFEYLDGHLRVYEDEVNINDLKKGSVYTLNYIIFDDRLDNGFTILPIEMVIYNVTDTYLEAYEADLLEFDDKQQEFKTNPLFTSLYFPLSL